MNLKGVGLAAVVAGLLFASGTASGVQSKVYDWENGATILGMYPANTFAHTSVTSPVHGGLRSLKLEKIPDGSTDTSQGYLAHITGLQDGDLITASFWIYDENTEGEDPRGRIWGHYTRGGIDGYAGSAGGNETYSAGPGWGLLSHTWTFDVGDLTQYDPRTGLVVEARVYGDDGQFMHFDDMTIGAPDHATIHVPGEPMAYGRLTTTQVDIPVTVNLCYTTHFPLQVITITSLPDPAHGVLKDGGVPFSVPHDLTGALTFEPAAGWSGVDTFSFQVTDTQAQTSGLATQEVAVQEDTVVISEVMIRPSSYQSTYEFIEIYNDSGENVYLTRLDSDVATDVLTDGNLVDESTGPALIPANSMRIIAIDNTAQYPDSFEEFRCDWGLNAGHIILVDLTQWEYLSAQPASTCSEVNASRVLLFGKIGTSPDEVLLDAVNLGLVNSAAGSCSGESYALNQTDLTAYFPSDPAPNTGNNDDVRVWKCSGDITAGLVYGAGTGDAGSPGYVPTHATAAYPYDPCVGACCLPDGTCLEATVSAFCALQCGTFHEDVACASAGCTAGDLHKCCLPNGACVDLCSSCECLLYNGNWDSGTTCAVSPICFVTAEAVINELDYDNPGTDDVEFVEVYGSPLMDLTGWSLEFFDGSDTGMNLYRTVDLTGVTIPADGYLVIGSDLAPEVDAPLYTVLETPPYTNLIQNGDPDGVVLLQNGTVVEALSYGGSFIARGGATGLLPLHDINATDTATGGLQKIPDASADGTTWVATTGQTPGEVNDITGACCDNGACSVLTEAECVGLGHAYIGDDTDCSIPNPCLPMGSCCLPDGSCIDGTQEYLCDLMGGAFTAGGTCSVCDLSESLPAFIGCLDGPVAPVAAGCEAWDLDGSAHVDLGDFALFQTAFCVPVLDQTPGAILINEIWADDPSTDTNEFIELYGTPSASLGGYSLIVVDGDINGYTDSLTFRGVNLAMDLSPYSLDANGYFTVGFGPNVAGLVDVDLDIVFGNGNSLADEIQNGSQTYALVPTADIAYCTDVGVPEPECLGNADELTPSSVAALTASAIDTVSTLDPDWGDITYFGAPLVRNEGIFAIDHGQRIPNGTDTNRPADWETTYGYEIGDLTGVPSPAAQNISIETIPGACCHGFTCTQETRAACEGSGGEFRGPGIECDPNPCDCYSIAVAEAQADGTTVCITGAIIANDYDLISSTSSKNFHIQDPVGTNGIVVYGGNAEIDALLAVASAGDEIRITGVLDTYWTDRELIAPFTITYLSSPGVPQPFPVSIADLQGTATAGDPLMSTLIVVENAEFATGDVGNLFAYGNYTIHDAAAPTETLTLRIANSALPIVGTTIPGGPVDIVGVAAAYSGLYQVQPREPGDITPH